MPRLLPRASWWLLAALLLPALAGCLPPQASYRPGFSTSRISGSVDHPPVREGAPRPFLVVIKQHYTFVELEGQTPIRRPTAQVVAVDAEGAFRIDLSSDVVGADVLFIAADHLTEVFRFRRQLGVGDVTYHASLRPMNDWRGHFYTFLKPQLEHLITEPRYQLNPLEQQRLADWMEAQQQRLAQRQAPSPAAEDGSPAPTD